jgi:hypothetical protein
MALPVGKMAPTAVVAAVVGYCCWPHLGGSVSEAPAKGKANAQARMAALLAPTPAPDPPRDPFGLTASLAAVSKPKPKPEPTKSTPPPLTPETRAETAKLLSSLSLKATWTRGNKGGALINGLFYTKGDSLKVGNNNPGVSSTKAVGSVHQSMSTKQSDNTAEQMSLRVDPPPSEPLVVAEILPDKVLLKHHGEIVELKYADKDLARPAAPPPKAGNAKSTSKGGK